MQYVAITDCLGELVTDVQRIDPDWWLVKNEAGQVS
jgi:hypothetical protein